MQTQTAIIHVLAYETLPCTNSKHQHHAILHIATRPTNHIPHSQKECQEWPSWYGHYWL